MTYGVFGAARPPGLRRRRLGAGSVLWRIDADAPRDWGWAGFPEPRNRFDPESGGFRIRYAATTFFGAARERYSATGRYIPADHAEQQVVRLELTSPVWVLDLRSEANLDALGVDDRISTGREPEVWAACHRLADAVTMWWPDVTGLLYRSRTTPSTSTNVALRSVATMSERHRDLRSFVTDLDELVLRHEFTVGFDY